MHAAQLVIGAMAIAFAPQQPPPAADAPVSIEHVRSALEKPTSKLTLKNYTPDFRIHIEQRRPMQDIFDKPPWQLPPIGWQPPALPAMSAFGTPMVSLDLLAIGRSMAEARRAGAARAASEEVRREIAAYCAAQPNGGAAIQICSISPAIR